MLIKAAFIWSKIKDSNFVKYYSWKKSVFYVVYSCDGKAKCLAVITPLFIVAWSLICWFGAQETSLITINVENGCSS